MTKIGVHLIFGENEEPFLEAALLSVEWADYVCAVNTAPYTTFGDKNEETFFNVVPKEKQRYTYTQFVNGEFDFAQARNLALGLADYGDYVLILDSDDVHYPEFEIMARNAVACGYDIITAHFWHLIGYKDLWGQEPHREILFKKNIHTQFDKAVHEGLTHPRSNPHLLPDYHYVHYGYIKPPREIFKRWVRYSEIEGDPHHYDGRNPDDALAGWFDNCQPFFRDHPPTVQEVLKDYPVAPRSTRAIEASHNIGLVLLTWNDAENLEVCLRTLAKTRQPFKLCAVDNRSTDKSIELIDDFMGTRIETGEIQGRWGDNLYWPPIDKSYTLAEALNIGFGHFMDDQDIDYIGWIHPDMVFERDTWLECLRYCLDTHPDIVKVGCAELGSSIHPEPCYGNSQCYLIRKDALNLVGLFNERFEACGGYEDWEHNYRLMKIGKVMIWPDALVRHNSMGTRKNHDNKEAGRRNAEIYYELVGTWSPVV